MVEGVYVDLFGGSKIIILLCDFCQYSFIVYVYCVILVVQQFCMFEVIVLVLMEGSVFEYFKKIIDVVVLGMFNQVDCLVCKDNSFCIEEEYVSEVIKSWMLNFVLQFK